MGFLDKLMRAAQVARHAVPPLGGDRVARSIELEMPRVIACWWAHTLAEANCV
jgi:hypothetical protein